MFSRKKISFKQVYELYLISCGDSGAIIGRGIIEKLVERGAVVRSLLINAGKISKEDKKTFDHRLSIDEKRDGYSKKFDDCRSALKNKRVQIKEYIEKVLPKNPKQLLIVTTGAGGTGMGSALSVLEILYQDYKLIPPVFTLLPEVFENSRVQYNAAEFLYQVAYRKENYGNAVIILDNKPSINELDIPFSTLSTKRLNLIPDAIGDLLFASFQKTIAEDFDGSESDLMEVIHTPGISVFVVQELSSDSSDETEGGDSGRISSIIIESVERTTSLSAEQIYDARNAFITISNIEHGKEKLSRQTEYEAIKLFKEFRIRRPFVKFVQTKDDEGQATLPMLHAIVAGLPIPPRILQIMQLGRDARKDVLYHEYLLNKEVLPLGIEKVAKLEATLEEKFNS